MGIVILSAGSRFAEGVASNLRQVEHDLDLNVMNPCQPGAIEQIINAQLSVFIMDGADGELAELVQLLTSELRVATNVSSLIEVI